ncbi:MAG: site-specific integrase [Clostridia bacterium]|nr:site-specific integrase [Clostridia bacterium]
MPKKGLNIHKRKDGRWEGRQEVGRKPDGTIRYRSVYGKTCAEVKEKIMSMSAAGSPIPHHITREKTFGDVVALWLQNSQVKNKGGTVNKYQNLIDDHIMPTLGGMKLADIDAITVNLFLQQKLENGRLDGTGGLSPSYVRSIMIIISSTINYAVKEKFCEPLNSPILKPAVVNPEIEVLTLDDQRKLEELLQPWENPTDLGIVISLYTGLRIGEICALSWDDIDFPRRIIKVRHTVARVKSNSDNGPSSVLIIDKPKTKASAREIPISDDLTDTLMKSRKTSSSEYVVSTAKGFVSPRTFDYRYHKVIASAGVPDKNYHALRHTFATRCIEAGVDVKSLSEILGHSNVSITLNTYVHSSLDMKRSQLEKLYALI